MTAAGWEAVIGLEIHVQLATATKMFCRCPNRFGDAPNTNVCPVCLAHPGMLPVPNEEAVRQSIRVGLALGCRVPERSEFSRKNYFYPDSPKAYQITQFDRPICAEGSFHVPAPGGGFEVGITRAHLEEDAAKMIHAGGDRGRIAGSAGSVVDFNRVGTPLLEIVTEPDLRSAEDARRFLNLLRATIVAIGASDCDMEKGSLRCDANVSVRRVGEDGYRTKTELKNMNSFRFLERGITAEIERQIGLYEAGAVVPQETLHFDPSTGRISSLRSKEEAHDYRYFPEPDLVPVEPSAALLAELAASLPELPAARTERLAAAYGLPEQTAELFALDQELGDWYEELAAQVADPRAAANWVANELSGHLNATGLRPRESPITPARLAPLLALVADGTLGSAGARQAFAAMIEHPERDAAATVEALGLAQVADEGALARTIDAVIAAHPDEVERYRGGRTQPDRLLRRPGDEGERGPRRAEGGAAPPARAARRDRLTATRPSPGRPGKTVT